MKFNLMDNADERLELFSDDEQDDEEESKEQFRFHRVQRLGNAIPGCAHYASVEIDSSARRSG